MKWIKEKWSAAVAWFENDKVPEWKKKLVFSALAVFGGFITLCLVVLIGYWGLIGLFHLCVWNGWVGAGAIAFLVLAVIIPIQVFGN